MLVLLITGDNKNNNAKGQNSLEEGCKWTENRFWCRVEKHQDNKEEKDKEEFFLLCRKGIEGRTFWGKIKQKEPGQWFQSLKLQIQVGEGIFAQSPKSGICWEKKRIFSVFYSTGIWTLLVRSEPKYSLFSLLTLRAWSAAVSPPSEQNLECTNTSSPFKWCSCGFTLLRAN